MKELSIEQKAEAYDKAIEGIQEILSSGQDSIKMSRLQLRLQGIFPELKESEDEKIRKAILAFIRQSSEVLDKQNQNNMIAWLEKQGEQKSITIDINKMVSKYSHTKDGDFGLPINCQIRAYRKGINDALNLSLGIKKQGERKSADSYCQENCRGFQETGKCFADGDCEAKREAESVDKVEPKFDFSVGQWIVATGKRIYLITKIDGFNVTLIDVDGDEYVFDTSSLEDAHLWNITKDAKDGDVLATDKSVFIYAEVLYNKPYAYCGVDKFGVFKDNCREYDWTNSVDGIHPATKEQRDTLFAKMHEAEYDWDTEKKELKKIEESENIKNQIMSEITDLVKDYITQKSAKCSEEDELSCFESALFTAFSDAWQQYLRGKEVDIAQWAKEHSKELLEAAKEELKGHNSAWSEEDTEISSMLIELIESKEKSIEAKVEFVAWLKSLKDRVSPQPKQEWSEVDEYTLNETIQHLKELIEIDKTKHCACDVQYYQRDIDWLKSLKDRIIA